MAKGQAVNNFLKWLKFLQFQGAWRAKHRWLAEP